MYTQYKELLESKTETNIFSPKILRRSHQEDTKQLIYVVLYVCAPDFDVVSSVQIVYRNSDLIEVAAAQSQRLYMSETNTPPQLL